MTTGSSGVTIAHKPVTKADLHHNAFSGHPVFILGTGPSIAHYDLTSLKDHYTFGCGGLLFWEDLPIMPSLYGINEYNYEIQKKVIDLGIPTFVTDWVMKGGAPYGKYWYTFTSVKEVSYGHIAGLEEDFTEVPDQEGFSSISCAIQPAIWLGFDPIYLLGHDFSWAYVDGNPRDERWWPGSLEHEKRILKSLEVLRARLDEHGRRVINLSPVAQENVLEKGDLSQVLGRDVVNQKPPPTPNYEYARFGDGYVRRVVGSSDEWDGIEFPEWAPRGKSDG